VSAGRFWHGGVRGLVVGDVLVPPCEHDGPTLKQYASLTVTGNDAARTQLGAGTRVFITPERDSAYVFAALYPPPGGALYEVEPIGDLEADHDAPGRSFAVERARIVAVDEAEVAFDPAAIEALV